MASGVLFSASDCSTELVLAMSNGGELLLMMKTAFGCGKKIVTVSERCRGLRERERDQRGVAQLTGGDRNRRNCGGGRADSGDKIGRPGGALGFRVRWKREEGRGGL